MPVALELYFDQDSDAHVRGLWERGAPPVVEPVWQALPRLFPEVFDGRSEETTHSGLYVCDGSTFPTACGVNPPAASVQVGTKKLIGDDFRVTLGPSVAALSYNPRGVTTVVQAVTVKVIGPHYTDSIMVNQVGKVIRQ